jgi:erythromycin esterase
MKYPLHSFRFLFFTIILFSCCFSLCAQEKKGSPFVTELNKILRPFTFGSQEDASLMVPKNTLAEMSIIALGESTHGTKEFNLYRSDIIKDQILHNNVKTIAMETDYCYSLVLNDYLISDKKDTLYKYLDKTGLSGIYKTQEVYNMLKWIKEYNSSKETKDRVRVLGIDMQDPYIITKSILDGFTKLKNIDSNTYKQLKTYNKQSISDGYKMSKTQKETFKNLVNTLTNLVKKEVKDTLNMLQLVRLFDQTLDLRGSAGMFTSYYRNLDVIRDRSMSENVLWLFNNSPSNGKLVLWAHNGHIAHTKLEGVNTMGYYLKNKLKDKYYAIGAAFDEGSVRIFDFENTRKYIPFFYPSSDREDAIEYVLKNCIEENFFLDIREMSTNDKLIPFLKKYRYTRVIGSTYQDNTSKDYFKYPLDECYEGLIFFKKANAAENITKKY